MDIQNVKSSQTQNINLPNVIDTEWLHLLLEAKAIGLSLEEIRAFLKDQKDINQEQQ